MAISKTSFDWTRKISPDIKGLDEIPLTGAAPVFPWSELAMRLGQSFERDGISITPGEIAWRTNDELFEGLGDSPIPLTIAIPSFQGTACWVMPEQELSNLESLLLTKDPHPISFQDKSLTEAFYRFLSLEILYNLSQINFDKTITPILTQQKNLPNEDSLCLDIVLKCQNQSIWGRLIISQPLRRSWVEHFGKRNLTSPLTQELSKKIEAVIHLQAGMTNLTYQDWSQVKLGDWISLDSFTLDQNFSSGSLALTINGKNAFKGQLQDGKVKITELCSYQEAHTPMAKQNEENEHLEPEETKDESHDDFTFDEETLTDDDLLFDEMTAEEEAQKKEANGEVASEIEEEQIVSESAAAVQEHPTATAAASKLAPAKEIQVGLVVEVGRIQMTMEKLLSLEPGNVLDLNVHPENGVDLSVNGTLIGKGELIRIGDSLGVRVLELG